MDIAFALRADALTKRGGDGDKVEKLGSRLRARGHRVHVVTSPGELRGLDVVDVVHLLNLELPVENLRYARVCARRGIPYVLSSIFHPAQAVENFVRYGEDRFNLAARRLGASPETALKWRELAKLARRRRVEAWALIPSWRTLQERLLDGAAHVIVATESERLEITRTFPRWDGSCSVAPNGATFAFTPRPPTQPRHGIVVVGRVEPRKNQNAILRALCTLPEVPPTTIIGAKNRLHRAYLAEFDSLIGRLPGVTWVDRLSHDELAEHYQGARLHLSASWYEIASQVDIEAVSLGCPTVPTAGSYITDHVAGVSRQVQPLRAWNDPIAFGRFLAQVYEESEGMQQELTSSSFLSWDEVVDRMHAIYVAAAGR